MKTPTNKSRKGEKKPSERINEIYLEICKKVGCHPHSEMANTYGYQEFAIIAYLDEVAQKNLRKT